MVCVCNIGYDCDVNMYQATTDSMLPFDTGWEACNHAMVFEDCPSADNFLFFLWPLSILDKIF